MSGDSAIQLIINGAVPLSRADLGKSHIIYSYYKTPIRVVQVNLISIVIEPIPVFIKICCVD